MQYIKQLSRNIAPVFTRRHVFIIYLQVRKELNNMDCDSMVYPHAQHVILALMFYYIFHIVDIHYANLYLMRFYAQLQQKRTIVILSVFYSQWYQFFTFFETFYLKSKITPLSFQVFFCKNMYVKTCGCY